jgi:sulfatase modifying factor 1
LTNCGACNENCCASLEVTGGTYYRTYSWDADGGLTGEAAPATISSFRLDKYLVTVGRFRQFVHAVLPADGGAGWLPPAGSGIHAYVNGGNGLVNSGDDAGVKYETGWNTSWNSNIAPTDGNLLLSDPPYSTWTDPAASQENLPIESENWYEAYAFCIWDGGFLPSEAEWEYAAAGGSQQREYPWGAAAAGTSNQYAIYYCYYHPSSMLTPCTGVVNIAPVGTATLGAGLWGQLDLAGDMWEWILDWEVTYVSPCTDCAYLTEPSTSEPERLLKGGAFLTPLSFSQPAFAYSESPSSRGNIDYDDHFGFRCARTP